MLKQTCGICSKEFLIWPYKLKHGRGKFCSRKCYELSKRGKPSWNKGKPAPWAVGNKHKVGSKNPYLTALNKSRTKDKNFQWKKDDVGYRGLHRWVERELGKPERCEFCGLDGLLGKEINWANKNHKYLRNVDDWLRLCVSCHKKYDIGKKQL